MLPAAAMRRALLPAGSALRLRAAAPVACRLGAPWPAVTSSGGGRALRRHFSAAAPDPKPEVAKGGADASDSKPADPVEEAPSGRGVSGRTPAAGLERRGALVARVCPRSGAQPSTSRHP